MPPSHHCLCSVCKGNTCKYGKETHNCPCQYCVHEKIAVQGGLIEKPRAWRDPAPQHRGFNPTYPSTTAFSIPSQDRSRHTHRPEGTYPPERFLGTDGYASASTTAHGRAQVDTNLDGAEGLSIETSSSQHLIRESQESVNYHELVVSKLKRKNINFSSQLECLECGRILGNATHGRDHVYNQHIPLTVPRFTCQFVDCRSRFKSNYESSALRHSREAGKKVFCDRCENWYSRNSYKNGQHQGSCRPRS